MSLLARYFTLSNVPWRVRGEIWNWNGCEIALLIYKAAACYNIQRAARLVLSYPPKCDAASYLDFGALKIVYKHY